MRRILAAFVLLLVASTLRSAPRSAAPVPLTPASLEFATHLCDVVLRVNQQYIQPVPEPELLKPALIGMYEAARMTTPLDLSERIGRAAARGNLILLIREAHTQTAGVLTGFGRDPMTVACQALFRSLDPFSGIVNKDEQRRNVALDQDARGVGIDLADYAGSGPLIVKTVFLGGAAQRAGIRPGDQITHVTGTPVDDTKPGRARNLGHVERLAEKLLHEIYLDPIPGITLAPVQVTFRRPGGLPRTVELEREPFRVETVLGTGRDDGHHWHYWADYKKRVAHVRVSMLAKGTAEELAAVLDRLQRREVRGLVLDLRWTPGGYLDDSVDVAALFLGDAPVATIKSRGEPDDVRRASSLNAPSDLPMAILVNGETSGGAELIAAALQDHKRAVIVGQRTRGKASVQRPLQVDLPGLPMKLTTGTFYRPSGKNLHRFPQSKPEDDWGVKPDVEFRVSPELDRQLKEWWQLQTLRPGPSLERLPLDDLSNDAPLRAAVDAVMALLDKKK